jgi:signal transduction histidine kinase
MKILVIEDNIGLSELICDLIEDIGFTVEKSFSAKEAIEFLKIESPRILILDYGLPDMNGQELLIELNNLNIPIPPFIVSTGHGDERIAVEMMRHGARDYIIKDSNFLDFLPEVIKRVDREIENENKRFQAELELQKKNLELSELIALKDKFFSIIAHDLRAPFSGFLGLTEVLSEQYNALSLEEIRDFGYSLKESALNLYKLLENLLEWSWIQRHAMLFNPNNQNASEIIDQNIDLLSQIAKDKSINLIKSYYPNIDLFFDSEMLNTILRNLISNAIKFTPMGGIVEVGIKQVFINMQYETCFFVKDFGVGMSQEKIENLFKLAKQITSLGTNNEKGSGLGLILCKEFVEKHGGKIWVESEVDKGSTFYFTIKDKDKY